MQVLVIGASDNPSRYSYKATEMLLEYHHHPILFSQKKKAVFGIKIENEWKNWVDVNTVTLYINSNLQLNYYQKIIDLNPKRVIFNPGTENQEFINILNAKGINAVEACTLVMLKTNQF